ncbi:hypothetical protein HDU98_011635 [Podochytrium sp. JEL0797]|nr:hypothetical protein HDU98_011635 [Podochytrium sp. JEL0797]
MFTPETTPEPCERPRHRANTFTIQSLKIVAPPTLLPHLKSKATSQGIDSELMARVAILKAFGNSPRHFLHKFLVCEVIGFGSNGVVLRAQHVETDKTVAIKIIYKPTHSTNKDPYPSEICVLKQLSATSSSRFAINHLSSWQDAHHFYLVTELFGTPWLTTVPESTLPPLAFDSIQNGLTESHTFPFSNGSCDLWAWQNSMRRHQLHLDGHTFIPSDPIKRVFRECVKAVQSIHNAGFFHGDVKVENLLAALDPTVQGADGAYPNVKLADFGHCQRVECGIQRYGTQEMSPPEFLPDSPFLSSFIDGQKADVFALGMVLHLLMSERGTVPSVTQAIRRGKVRYTDLVMFDEGLYMFDDSTGYDDDAWNLLNAMCFVNPRRRIGLDQVLQHPWLSG